jgi:predicted ferric reductase
MNRDKIWSECDQDKLEDERIVKFIERNETGDNTIELAFEKPEGFQHQKGQYAILNLMEPKVTELDLPYRWLRIASTTEEQILRFHIELNSSSFNKSCQLLNIGDKALVFGPVG